MTASAATTVAHEGTKGSTKQIGVETADSPPAGQERLPPAAQGWATADDKWLHLIGGGVGGMVGALVTSPLDVVRTRLQSKSRTRSVLADQHPQASRIRAVSRRMAHPLMHTGQALAEIYGAQGVRGLFAGLGPNLVGIIPSRSLQFAAYGNGKRLLTEWNNGKETPLIHLFSAASAGIITATIMNPVWMVKTRMQLQHMDRGSAPRYPNSLNCIVSVFRTEGIRGFYKGTSASYLGISEGTIQWVIYEQIKKVVRGRHQARSADASLNQISKSINKWFEYFGAAASAKLIAAIIAYPHEVLRTRLRQLPDSQGNIKYTGLGQAIKTIWREEGALGFYGGLTAHLLRTVPNAAIIFLSYELVLHHFGSAGRSTM